MIVTHKTFVGLKPRTTVYLSAGGRESFVEYLDALANVLLQASEALEQRSEPDANVPDGVRAGV